jgi:prolyl oligopeptidase
MHKILLLTAACLLPLAAFAAPSMPPPAAIHPVTTNDYGTSVTDNYRWMETPGSAALAAYMKAQNNYTQAMLAALPGRAQLLADMTKAEDSATSTQDLVIAGGKYFYTQTGAGQNSAKLYMRDIAGGRPKLLIDPDKIGNGMPAAINFFQPSMDGKYVAYGVSLGGSEQTSLRVISTATGQDQGISISRVEGDNAELLPVWWLPDDSFAYYRLQKLAAGESPNDYYLKSRTWLHHLGRNPNGDGDTPIFGYGLDAAVPAHADQDAVVETSAGSAYAFGLLTQNEDQTDINDIYVSPIAAVEAGKPVWKPVFSSGADVSGYAVAGNTIYLLTSNGAPRFKIVATSLQAPEFFHAETVVPQSDAVITGISVGRDALYVSSTLNGYSRLARLPFHGGSAGPAQPVALPYAGTISGGLGSGVYASGSAAGAVFPLASWTHPELWFRDDPASGKVVDTLLQGLPGVDTSGLVSREVMATSYDGTQIPLSIIMQAGTKLDGKNPTLLEGYGSYGITLSPDFARILLPWFRRGGIYAVAHVRGGGWYGEGWHQAGMKLTKLNTVFDFIACARYLEEQHYTSPAYLGGLGGSAGGITIGGAITWAPELFAAAIDSHGDTDSLRMEFTPNGPPNIPEFGTVTTEAGFHGLYAMSAMEHIHAGTKYPAVLAVTGANDPRVEPYTVAKFAAALQAASSSGKPVLLDVYYQSGHGVGDSRAQSVLEFGDELSFVLWQTGDPAFQPKF